MTNEKEYTLFSDIMKKHLQDKNLSRVARELEIPKTLLHEWVQARRMPTLRNIHHLKRLADYFSISLTELLIGENRNTLLNSMTFEDKGVKYRIKIERLD